MPIDPGRSLIRKIIAAGPARKTRLHDERGNFIGFTRLILNLPRAVFTGVMRVMFGYRPPLPWISYSAIRILDRDVLTKSSRVLEFGSGMSTAWYASRAGEVYSVEDFKPWFDKVSASFRRLGVSNVTYRLAASRAEYCGFMGDDEEGFDLVMVDGSDRADCVAHAARLLRPGGVLYLDNSDRETERLAESHALEFALTRNASVTYLTDFAPTSFFAEQGLMVRLPRLERGADCQDMGESR